MTRRAASTQPNRLAVFRRRPPSRPAPDDASPLAGTTDGEAVPTGSRRAWALTKLLALLLLFAASGLLYHVATSDEFRISSVVVAGNQLLSSGELEAAAAVSGANIFWIRQEEVRRRLQAIPAVQSARATAYLPNRLEIRIGERPPAAVWLAADALWLVDREGRVLGTVPTAPPLLAIRATGGPELRAGARVDPDALETAFRLQQLLPAAGTAPREFEYSADAGVSVLADFGPRIRFGDSTDLDWKVTALGTLRRELERSGQRAELIDVRFKDRPYVR